MDAFEFKNQLKAMKEAKKRKREEETNTDNDKKNESKYVKVADIINNKLQEEADLKNEEVLKNMIEVKKERDDWFEKRNLQLNKAQEKKIQEEIQKDKILEEEKEEMKVEEIPNEFELKVNGKEWIVKSDPNEIIEEVSEQGEVKRFITVDKYTTEYKCSELYNWFHKIFQEWEQELDVI
jgi:hypothetical protein